MASSCDQQLGQLGPVVAHRKLLKRLLAKLSDEERRCLAVVCSGLCTAVRALPVKLRFTGEEGEAAAASPPSRAFTGAKELNYCLTSNPLSYGAMVALLGYAADTMPSVTQVKLRCDPECLEMINNPAAMVGPLQALARMKRLNWLCLEMPRLEGASVPKLVQLSPLLRLRVLELQYITPDTAHKPQSLPPILFAFTLMPASMVPEWLPAMEACRHLRQLHIMYDAAAPGHAPSTFSLLALMAPRLLQLTRLEMSADKDIREQLCADAAAGLHGGDDGQLLTHCFPSLVTLECYEGVLLPVTQEAHWRLLAACPALEELGAVAATVAPPPDLKQLSVWKLAVALMPSWTQADMLCRHCPLLATVAVWLEHLTVDSPQTLQLPAEPLQHLQILSLTSICSSPQLVEVCLSRLAKTHTLQLHMTLAQDGALPNLSCCSHLTQLEWLVCEPDDCETITKAHVPSAAAGVPAPEVEDLLCSLHGCQKLEELTLEEWSWFDARLALALAETLPTLRKLRLAGCGSLPGNSSGTREERLRRIRGLLGRSLALELV